MHEGAVEATRYPRNPLDVLAQQIVAMVGVRHVDRRRAASAPCAARRRSRGSAGASFEGVLDMLSGRYPSDEFAELRPRLTWDRVADTLTGRDRAPQRVASPTLARFPIAGSTASSSPARSRARAASASSTRRWSSRSHVGETFMLGASTWRIEEITHDRVMVSAAPGEPGKMPFWKGDTAEPAARARPAHRAAHARARRNAARRGAGPSAAQPRPRPDRRGEPAPVPRGPEGDGDAPSPTTARSSSSDAATSWATGASACCRRSAAAC